MRHGDGGLVCKLWFAKKQLKEGSGLPEPIHTLTLIPRKDFSHFPIGCFYTDIYNYMLTYKAITLKALFLNEIKTDLCPPSLG